ncbi:unnamed protein product, partial [Didymodactylos carnosus]
ADENDNETNESKETTVKTISTEWQNEQCKMFSNTRNQFYLMRDKLRSKKNFKITKLKNINSYWKFCFGDNVPVQSILSLDTFEKYTVLPTMSKMISLTQPQTHELLQYEIKWIETCGFTIQLALYIYSTLVAIEKPISEDFMYTMRLLSKACQNTRLKLENICLII